MEINTYNTEGVIDLHIHTNYSATDAEYMKMNLFPADLLDEVLKYTEKFGCHATIAITDHNSILGSKEVCEVISQNPKKYRNITFVTGCEFSVSCKSLGTFHQNGNEKNIFHTIHMLGYNFNINDKTINYYSKLRSLKEGSRFTHNGIKYPLGNIVLAGKSFLKDVRLDLPLSAFTDFETKHFCDGPQNFIQNVDRFCIYCKKSFGLKDHIFKSLTLYLLGLPSDYLKDNKKIKPRDVRYDNVIRNNKLDIMEMMGIIENAGGVSVLAHPNLIKLNNSYIKKYKDVDDCPFIGKEKKKVCDENSLDVYNKSQLKARREMMDHILQKLVYDARDPVTGNRLKGLAGLELLHSTGIYKDYYSMAADLVLKYNLYSTCGSDKHGDLLKDIMSLGQIMPCNVEDLFNKSDDKKTMFSVFSSKFVDDIISHVPLTRKNGNHQIELFVSKQDKHMVLDFNNIKRFVEKYANPIYRPPQYQPEKTNEEFPEIDLNKQKTQQIAQQKIQKKSTVIVNNELIK